MYVPTTCFACLRFNKGCLRWNAYDRDRNLDGRNKILNHGTDSEDRAKLEA